MKIVNVRSVGLGNAAAEDLGQGAPASSFFPNPQPAAMNIEIGSNTGGSGTAEVRSVVERRFMSMNEAHDRIRTEVLGLHDPAVE